jgi:amine acid ABC transporter, permease protein, 3-TM region, His/Glu/Gln/Arg/opine family
MSFDLGFAFHALLLIASALPTTFMLTFVSTGCGLLIGIVVALVRLNNVRVIRHLAAFYVSFIRGTPVLMHLFLVYFGLPVLIDEVCSWFGAAGVSVRIPLVWFVLTAFSLTAGAYLSEVVRSGIAAVDRGQLEAAYAVGMTTSQAYRRIVLPQALAASLPNLANIVVGMLHGSTLAFTLTVVEIFGKTQLVAAQGWNYLESFAAAALLYWGLTVLIENIAAGLERRINRFAKGGVA